MLPQKANTPGNSTMKNSNERNVHIGPDSLKEYFDPDYQPPLPLVELPEYLNLFYQDGVRIYAKMMTMHPANNVKAMPVEILPSTRNHRSTLTQISFEYAGVECCPKQD